MAMEPYARLTMKSPTATAETSAVWALPNEESLVPWTRTAMPSWSAKGRGALDQGPDGEVEQDGDPAGGQ
jgi:hypothetical protein